MATIRKRGDKWYAEVNKNGQRKGKSFTTKAEANLWAAQTELELVCCHSQEAHFKKLTNTVPSSRSLSIPLPIRLSMTISTL
jgi:hypothetical protein